MMTHIHIYLMENIYDVEVKNYITKSNYIMILIFMCMHFHWEILDRSHQSFNINYPEVMEFHIVLILLDLIIIISKKVHHI